MKFDYKLKYYDVRMLAYALALNVLGILIIRSATGASDFKDPQVFRQIMGSCAGFALCLGLSLLDYRVLTKQGILIYLLSVAMLAGVKIYGTASGHGAVRWIQVPVLGKLQPAEFVKVGLILFFASYLQKAKENINQPHVLGLGLLYFAVPVVLVLLQPNLSTAIIMTVIVAAMIYASPINTKWVAGFLAVALLLGLGLAHLFRTGLYDRIPFIRGYQAERIQTFLNPEENSQTFYQQMYSMMAIGSGRAHGKGLNNDSIFSVKNGDFLVEEDNDFVFAVIGEELGFRGSAFIVVLFLLIVLECLYIAYRARNLGGRLIAVGMMAWIGFQTFTNIAVATGLFPNTGITLPFFSRGASSLISVYAGLGILLNVALQRQT